jgi:hypothetical protein
MAKLIEFGWGAPSFAQQLPDLPPKDAEAFDADNAAIIRLSVRGALTESQRDSAIRKVTRAVERVLAGRAALASGEEQGR